MQAESQEEQLRQAARLWNQSRFPIAFTGAGISVASGIPDFRSPGGIWSKYDPMEVATGDALRNNPKKVWQFLVDTADLLQSCDPNEAHYALAELERDHGLQAIITQNVDNLHQRAGSGEVIEYHGNFERHYCQCCNTEVDRETVQQKVESTIPPICDNCQDMIRPDVVFFGEAIPMQAMQKSQELTRNADLVLITGTSGEVAPANTIPREVKMRGGTIIEINKGPTHYRNITDIRFDAPVEEILPQFVRMLKQ